MEKENMPEGWEHRRVNYNQPIPKHIHVWGGCDENNVSYIYSHRPQQAKHMKGVFWTARGDSICTLGIDNLFPKNKPQKFRLVPVEDD